MLHVIACPKSRLHQEKTSIGPRLYACIDRWKELGCPQPKFVLTDGPYEEWLPEFEVFLDSYPAAVLI